MSTTTTRRSIEVVCPDWCLVEYVDHVADLPQIEGSVIHWSTGQHVEHYEGDCTTEVRVSTMALPDGTPDDSQGAAALVYLDDTALTVEQARRIGVALLDAARRLEDRSFVSSSDERPAQGLQRFGLIVMTRKQLEHNAEWHTSLGADLALHLGLNPVTEARA